MIKAIDTKALKQQQQKLLIVDVREPIEYLGGALLHSINIPLGQLEHYIPKLKKQHLVVMVCRTGNRSTKACMIAEAGGLPALNLTGGVEAWIASGYTLEKRRI